MDGTRPRQPLTESQLDRELEAALRVEPTPEFLALVRSRISAEPEAAAWRLAAVASGFSRTLRTRAIEPLWAVAIVGIVLTVIVPRWMNDERPVVRPAIANVALPSVEGTDLKVNSSGNREAVEPAPGYAQRPRSAARSQTRPDETRSSEVLISENERRAFDALLSAVAQNRLPVRVVAAGEPEDGVVIPAVKIGQLTIEPLQLMRLE
jgi:hypothetical protein